MSCLNRNVFYSFIAFLQIKILKRQNGPTSKSVQQQTKKPIKTLAEKEAEYAAARSVPIGWLQLNKRLQIMIVNIDRNG